MHGKFSTTSTVIAIMLSFLTPQLLHAQAPLKIAIVDVEKVVEGYRKWEKYRKELKDIEKKIKEKKAEVEQEIQAKIRSLELLMKREDKQEQLKQIEAYSTAESKKLQPRINDFKDKRDEYLKECLSDIKKAIAIVGEEQGYDAVFTKELCLYAKFDISRLVMEKANQLYQEETAQAEKENK